VILKLPKGKRKKKKKNSLTQVLIFLQNLVREKAKQLFEYIERMNVKHKK